MKKIFILSGLLFSVFASAQLGEVSGQLSKVETEATDRPDGWVKQGTVSLLFNQSAFSNWVSGGTSSIAGNANVNYDFNYKKGDLTWDNRIMLGYGMTKNKGEKFRKTDDRIELNSLVGKKAFGNWSYSFFVNFKTQFTDGFDYDNDLNRNYATSGLFKPAYLTFGPGMLWKKHENLKVNIAPLTSKMTFISGEVWQYDGTDTTVNDGFISSKDVEMFGVDAGKSMNYELGFYASAYYKLQLMENVSMENILAAYSNYLEDPQNVDIDYTMNLVMQINKYLSTNLTVQAIYDDNAFQGLQLREVFGLGVNFNF